MAEEKKVIDEGTISLIRFINSQIKFNDAMIGIARYELKKTEEQSRRFGEIIDRGDMMSRLEKIKTAFNNAINSFESARTRWTNSMSVLLEIHGMAGWECQQILHQNIVIPETKVLQ